MLVKNNFYNNKNIKVAKLENERQLTLHWRYVGGRNFNAATNTDAEPLVAAVQNIEVTTTNYNLPTNFSMLLQPAYRFGGDRVIKIAFIILLLVEIISCFFPCCALHHEVIKLWHDDHRCIAGMSSIYRLHHQ